MAELDKLIQTALHFLKRSRHTVALTGAGISTPSGIPDFRSPASGLWQKQNPLEVATIYAFRRQPQRFYDWIHPLAKCTLEAEPNEAHLALTALEKYGPLKSIITQNIDMLHSKAGSQTVHEVHGHLREVTCLHCYRVFKGQPFLLTFIDNRLTPHCPECNGVLKPNVILFGEQLPVRVLNQARKEARLCDVMLIAGSSLEVAPAGDLPLLARSTGARLIIVNYSETHLDHLADVVIHADVVEILPQLSAPFQRNAWQNNQP